MRFDNTQKEDSLIVTLSGDLDESGAPETRAYLDSMIDHNSCDRLILDFRNVDFMDSTGIGVLLGRYKKTKASQMELCVTNLNPQVDKVFRISGLYQIIKAVSL